MKLLVTATYGSSLESWRRDGIFARELALYAAHAGAGVETLFLSHGGRGDHRLAADAPWLTPLVNPGVHPRFYGVLAHRIHARAARGADVIKTNQMFGAHIARRLARLARTPLVVRQGYGHYEHRVEEHGAESPIAEQALAYERRHLRAADASVFTTRELADRAIERHALDAARVHVVPNYVDPDVWSPAHRAPDDDAHEGDAREDDYNSLRLAFYGRFTEQKNLEALIEAAAAAGVRLTLIGDGPLRARLAGRARALGAAVDWPGRLDQSALTGQLARADAFVLPSHYEGHPKALIEAMCHGMPILAADSPGVASQIADGETGLLAPPTVEGLRAGIDRLRALGPAGRAALGAAARRAALARYGVETIAAQERELLQAVVAAAAR